jgi:acid phosphatase type 7
MTVMWETSAAAAGRLEYGATPQCEYLYDEPQAVTLHQIRLTELAAGTRYYYKISPVSAAGQPAAETGSFLTAPAAGGAFTFAAYGDSRADPVVHHAIASQIAAAAPTFFLHTGDFVTNGNDVSLWGEDFFAPAADLLRAAPFLPSLGNHEYNAQAYYAYFATPAGESGSATEAWYSCNYGSLHLVVLDTDQDVSTRSAQYAWLVKDLAAAPAANAAWRIVSMHDPAYSSSLHGPTPAVQQYLVPVFEYYGVRLVISGHDHAYIRSVKNGVTYIVSGGGGAVLYPVNRTPNPYQAYAASAFHFVVFTVNDTQLRGEARDIAGTPFDTFTIQRR